MSSIIKTKIKGIREDDRRLFEASILHQLKHEDAPLEVRYLFVRTSGRVPSQSRVFSS